MVIKDYRDNYLIIIEITLMMNKYKQPKTEWMTKAWEDKQAICKLVEWSKTEGIGLIVIKPQNEIYPEMFYFVFSPETADINKQWIIGWKSDLEEINDIVGIIIANEMKMEGMSETVNLFNCLVRANTILFHYTTPDGRDEMVKFPLAGFCENYLMQFAK